MLARALAAATLLAALAATPAHAGPAFSFTLEGVKTTTTTVAPDRFAPTCGDKLAHGSATERLTFRQEREAQAYVGDMRSADPGTILHPAGAKRSSLVPVAAVSERSAQLDTTHCGDHSGHSSEWTENAPGPVDLAGCVGQDAYTLKSDLVVQKRDGRWTVYVMLGQPSDHAELWPACDLEVESRAFPISYYGGGDAVGTLSLAKLRGRKPFTVALRGVSDRCSSTTDEADPCRSSIDAKLTVTPLRR